MENVQKEIERLEAEALSGSAGGGGWLSKALGWLVGIGAGAAGGGGSWSSFGQNLGIPGRASGGPITAGMPYRVHKDELIVPRQNGMVFNKQQQQGLGGTVVNNHYHFTVPKAQQSAKQRLCDRQAMERIMGLATTLAR